MPILHLLQIEDPQSAAVANCLTCSTTGDLVVIAGHLPQEVLQAVIIYFNDNKISCRILSPDSGYLSTEPVYIDYPELIELSCEYTKVVSWF